MCDPKPGARCSADTAKELREAQRRLAAANSDVDREPANPSARRRLSQAEAKLAVKSAAYDSSPKGQRELVDAIAAHDASNASGVDELRTRLYVGRATRISQKRALARLREGSVDLEVLETGKVLNRLRHPDGGFTLHPETGREETIGFFVSPYPERQKVIPAKKFRPVDLLQFAKTNADLFDQEYHYLTAWNDQKAGVVALDLWVKTTSAELARSLAEKHHQPAFYDAQTGGYVGIKTKGTKNDA